MLDEEQIKYFKVPSSRPEDGNSALKSGKSRRSWGYGGWNAHCSQLEYRQQLAWSNITSTNLLTAGAASTNHVPALVTWSALSLKLSILTPINCGPVSSGLALSAMTRRPEGELYIYKTVLNLTYTLLPCKPEGHHNNAWYWARRLDHTTLSLSHPVM